MIYNPSPKTTPYSVTRDSGASVRVLRSLEKEGYIKIFDVMLENGRENKKVKNKILPTAVLNHCRWGEAVWASEDSLYEEMRRIIGRRHIKDAMHLEAHIRNGHDYFVTEDTDFLHKRDELAKRFDVKICTPTELDAMCRNTSLNNQSIYEKTP